MEGNDIVVILAILVFSSETHSATISGANGCPP